MNGLIYDRTSQDVTFAQENQSSENWLKGAYNYVDLNRVEQCCQYLSQKLNEHGYNVNIETKINWTINDFQTYDDMLRIRNNIEAISNAFASITQIHGVQELNSWDYEDANNWEKILWEINRMLVSTENYQVYSGVANLGQQRFWQHRFRLINEIGDNSWEDIEYIYWYEIPADTTWNGLSYN